MGCALLETSWAPPLAACVAAWLAVEMVFWATCQLAARQQAARLQRLRAAGPRPLPTAEELGAAMRDGTITHGLLGQRKRGAERTRIAERFFSDWWHGVPLSEVCAGNVDELMAVGFCGRGFKQLPASHQALVSTFRKEVEEIWDIRFPPGFNPDIKLLPWFGHMLKPMHKPLAAYLAIFAANGLARLVLRALGFRRQPPLAGTSARLPYWVRSGWHASKLPHAAGEASGDSSSYCPLAAPSAPPPCVFAPGLGLGLVQYLPLLLRVVRTLGAADMVIIELPMVAANLRFEDPPTLDTCAREALAILERCGVSSACFMAHSFGTLLLARMLQLQREVICGAVLLEPVSMISCNPKPGPVQILQDPPPGLLWRRPRAAMMAAARHIFARDYGVCHALSPEVLPFNYIYILPSQLPPNSVLVLSERDDLVPAQLTMELLAAAEHSAEVLLIPQASHGTIIYSPSWQARTMRSAARVLEEAATAAAAPPLTPLPRQSKAQQSAASIASASSLSDAL